jgi:hypothetical protein
MKTGKDIIVFNPYTLAVLHVHQSGAVQHISPVTIALQCGCSVVV